MFGTNKPSIVLKMLFYQGVITLILFTFFNEFFLEVIGCLILGLIISKLTYIKVLT